MSIDVQLPKVQTHSSHSLWHHRNMHTNTILFYAVVLFARPTFRPQKFGLRADAKKSGDSQFQVSEKRNQIWLEREFSSRLRETHSPGGRFSKGGGLRLVLMPSDNPCGAPRSLIN